MTRDHLLFLLTHRRHHAAIAGAPTRRLAHRAGIVVAGVCLWMLGAALVFDGAEAWWVYTGMGLMAVGLFSAAFTFGQVARKIPIEEGL